MNTRLEAVVLSTHALTLERGPAESTPSEQLRAAEEHVEREFSKDHGRGLLALGLTDDVVRFSPSIEYWRELSARFSHELLVAPETEQLREGARVTLTPAEAAEWAARVPAMVGAEYVDAGLVLVVWEVLHRALVDAVRAYDGPVEQALRRLAPRSTPLEHRVHFHLVENKADPERPFAFLATYATQGDAHGTLRHLPLGNALTEYGDNTSRLVALLAAVHKAAQHSRFIHGLIESGEIFQPLCLSPVEAYTFLRETPIYEQAGLLCRIPRWWSSTPRRVSVALTIGASGKGALTTESLLGFSPMLHIDGEPISEEEARRILSQYEGLAFIKGKWTVVDRAALEKNLALFREARKLGKRMHVTLAEALRMLSGMERPSLNEGQEWKGEVFAGEHLKSVLDRLGTPTAMKPVAPPRGLRAELRPYQHDGLRWLCFVQEVGLGACLADDMGLGKTLQVLALLAVRKEQTAPGYGVSLLVAPASLIDNWVAEIDRFVPALRSAVAHPQYHTGGDMTKLAASLDTYDIVITTYAMVRRLTWLAKRQWYCTILDEAQAIKNPAAAQTKAVKAIGATYRIALTGTPIENRLGDLWSLMDFTNRGLLGSAKAFRGFVASLESKPAGYARLREAIRPCLLRRLKTDKSIIADLPDKIEMKTWAGLSRTQAALYQQLVSELSGTLERAAEGIQRRGLILAYLLKFKQVCNHPDQLAGMGSFDERDSGKFERLRQLCEPILEQRERVLIFTQFAEMVDPLDRFLAGVFGRPGLQLHGGTPVARRKQIVARFQRSDEYTPYFVLSVKAGGVGLNLTAANHVVHFDRWWNPAVERQAEDRTYRIGQTRNVVVHKFVCKGTVEERIDLLIEDKKQLSEQVLSSGAEAMITELSNEQIRKMVSLTYTGKEQQ
jgi:superfamily II DNA or RNA helicase